MGNSGSAESEPEAAQALSEASGFTDKEIKRLLKRFTTITSPAHRGSKPTDGWAERRAVLRQPELAMCPLAGVAVEFAAEEPGAEFLNFREFVMAMSLLSPKTSYQVKREAFMAVMGAVDGAAAPSAKVRGLFRRLMAKTLPDETVTMLLEQSLAAVGLAPTDDVDEAALDQLLTNGDLAVAMTAVF